jgi:hypothetical protein
MLTKLNSDVKQSSRILLFSQRGLRYQAANCCLYEFEDLIADFDRVDLFIPNNEYSFSRKLHRIIKYVTKSDYCATKISPFPHQYTLDQEYDLLFAVLDNPWQIYLLDSIQNWREKCRYVACYVGEIWDPELDNWRLLQEPFQYCDRIFLGVHHSVEKLSKQINIPCSYLAPGVDTVLFSPYPFLPYRSLDLCYVGRRVPAIHQTLLDLTTKKNFFYYYDTAKKLQLEVENHQEHRRLLANLLKRSRYTICTYAKFNRLEETGGYQEIGYRFFESAAAGTVMLGIPPKTEVFQKYFGWSDSIIEIDLNTSDINNIITELDAQPERLIRISRDNVINSLQKHDWVYRWREVLTSFKLELTSSMLDRERYLQQLVDSIQGQAIV